MIFDVTLVHLDSVDCLHQVYGWLQISSAATSKQLSEPTYPTFFRTVPSDAMQAKAIIWMCTRFGWDSIALFYHGDSYGVYLANALITESTSGNNSIRFELWRPNANTFIKRRLTIVSFVCVNASVAECRACLTSKWTIAHSHSMQPNRRQSRKQSID